MEDAEETSQFDEREDVQKKTFTKWINAQFTKTNQDHIGDLFEDLRDGTQLLSLLQILSGCDLKPERGKMRVHHLNNVNRAISLLENQYGIKLVNISSNDIVDGNPKLILGLLWSIIQNWQVKYVLRGVMGDVQPTNLEKTLLEWCQEMTQGYQHINIQNFTSSWKDGLAFNALLHKFNPHMFTYDDLYDKDNAARLEHAFTFAQKHLGIEKLLDVEDVDVEIPDKKSIMMYVMCYFQALSQREGTSLSESVSTPQGVPSPTQLSSVSSTPTESSVPSSQSSPTRKTPPVPPPKPQMSPTTEMPSEPTTPDSSSNRQSTISSSSADTGTYHVALEYVLAWLLEAEESLQAHGDIGTDVQTVKVQFHDHEDFMMQLTRNQSKVGNVLQEGNQIISEGKPTDEEENEIRVQMALLNNRWEELRVKAMDRQTKLQNQLMSLQQGQLDQLSLWLSDMEEKISREASLGADLESIRSKIDLHKVIQQELEKQQVHVNNLQNMVVVVDENNSDSAYAALESQLESLGQRWAGVCKWVEEQWILLQEVFAKWQYFTEEQKLFNEWLKSREKVLDEMAQVDMSEPKNVIEQVRKLKCIEQEMDTQVQKFDDLNDLGQELVQLMDGSPEAVDTISTQLVEFQERWDSLVQKMEIQSKQIAHSGMDFSVTKGPDGVQTITITRQEEGRTITETVTTSAVQSFSSYPSSAKRPRIESLHKRDFDEKGTALNEWLEKTEINLELVTMEAPDPQDRLTLEEQMVLVKDTENDVQAHESMMNEWKKLAENLKHDKDLTDETRELVVRKTEAIEKRWDDLTKLLADTKVKLNMDVDSKKFYDDLGALKEVMVTYEKWVNNADKISEEAMEISRQLEQCRVKSKAMKSHEEQIESVTRQAKELESKVGDTDGRFLKELAELNARWVAAFEKIGERQKLLMKAMERAPPKSFLDAMQALVKWIEGVENLIESEPLLLNREEVMNEQLQQYRDLQEDIQDHVGNLQYINRTGENLQEKASTPVKAQQLHENLKQLNLRWDEISSAIDQRVFKLEAAIEQLKQFKNQAKGLNRWMGEMEVFLQAEDLALGDVETLKAQIQESDGVQDDIQTLEPNLDNIHDIAKHVASESEPTFAEELQDQVDSINKRWTHVLELASTQNENLKQALERSQKFITSIEDVQRWIVDTKQKCLTEEYVVSNREELDRRRDEMKELKNLISTKEKDVNEMNEEASVMLTSEKSSSAVHQNLSKQLLTVNGEWSNLYQKADRQYQIFEDGNDSLNRFQYLVKQGYDYCSRLEKKLEEGPKGSVDAEEISEELDDLENFVSPSCEEERKEVEDIAAELIDSKIMVETISLDLQKYLSRSDEVNLKYKSRTVELEDAIQQAQNREGQMIEMSQWMTEVMSLLQCRLDADILAGDLPNEYETLKVEFEQNEALLDELGKQASECKSRGNTEAGDRLEQQVLILKKHFSDVMAKFTKFQRPVEFEPKMTNVKRIMDEIDEHIHFIEIRSEDLETVQGQHEHCMKFYRNMSEIKPEVEYVIKTGRQVAEKKQVDFPDKLNAQLDALKQQYNDIGAQVTRGKQTLDKALRLCKKISKDKTVLKTFLTSLDKELTEKENAQKMPDIEKEVEWINQKLTELKKQQSIFTVLMENFRQVVEVSEDGSLPEGESSLKELEKELDEAKERLNNKLKELQEQNAKLEEMWRDFKSQLGEVTVWLDKAEKILTETKQIPAEQQATEVQMTLYKSLQQEQSELASQVGQVRDAAVNLMNHSDKYNTMVEPELSHLNQRWHDVTTNIKERQTLQPEVFIQKESATFAMTSHARPSVRATEATTTDISLLSSMDIDGQFDHIFAALELYNSNVTSVDPADSNENVETSLEEKQRELDHLQRQVTFVLDKADLAVHQTSASDPEKAQKISSRMDELKVRWNSIKHNAENQKRDEDLLGWLYEVEVKLNMAGNDAEALKVVEQEICRRQEDVDTLNRQGNDLTAQSSNPAVESSLAQLNRRWQEVRTRISNQVPATQTSRQDDTQTTVTMATVSTTTFASRKVVFSAEPSQFEEEVQKLLTLMGEIEEELESPVLSGGQYEDFSTQEDKLKAIKEALDTIQPSVESADMQKDDVLSNTNSDEQVRIQKLVERLRTEWSNVNTNYRERHGRWTHSVEQWGQFHCNMKDLSSWLTEAEEKLTASRNSNGQLNILVAKAYQKELENDIRLHQSTVNSLNTTGRDIIGQSSAPDESLLNEKLDTLNHRWHKVCSEVADRKEKFEEESLQTAEFAEQMDHLFFWLDDMENLLHRKIGPTDEDGLEEQLERIREKEDELSHRQENLHALNMSGQRLMSQSVLSNMDRENIKKDLAIVNERWNRVICSLPDKQKAITDKLLSYKEFSEDTDALKKWVDQTKVILESQQGPVDSATDHEDMDSVVVDPKTMQAALKSKQTHMDRMNAMYQAYVLQSKQLQTSIPQPLQQKVGQLNDDWEEIQEIATRLRPSSSYSLEKKVFEQAVVQEVELQPDLVTSAQRVESPLPWPEMDEKTKTFTDYLRVLLKNLQTQIVLVGDIQNIEEAISKLKNTRQELDRKEGEMNAVMEQAGKLMKETPDEVSRIQLDERVERIRSQWDEVNSKTTRRQTQLDDMLLECRQYDEMQAEFDRWIAQVEEDVETHSVLGQTADQLEKQLEGHKKLQQEVDQWKKKVDALNKAAKKLIDEYGEDDTSKITSSNEKLNKRWTQLAGR